MKKFKSYNHLLLTLSTFLCGSILTFASTIPVHISGEALAPSKDTSTYISDNNRVMLPFRQVSESLNIDIAWEAPYVVVNGHHALTGEMVNIKLKANDPKLLLNGKSHTSDQSIEVVDGHSYIPIRLFAEILGYNVSWANQAVHISLPTPAPKLENIEPAAKENNAKSHSNASSASNDSKEKPAADNNSSSAKPSTDNNSSSAKPSTDNNSSSAKPSTDDNSSSAKPSTNNNTTCEEPSINNNTTPAKPSADNNSTCEDPSINSNTIPVKPSIDNNNDSAKPSIDNNIIPVKPSIDNTIIPVKPPVDNNGEFDKPSVTPDALPSLPSKPSVPEVPVSPIKPNESIVDSRTQFENEVLVLVNKERQKVGIAPLQMDEHVRSIAREKSRDMNIHNYFDHNSPTYGSPFDMLKASGVTYSSAAENIAAGYDTPEAVVIGWMNSPGHRRNILDANLTHIGVGYYADGNYWTQMFITPR